MKEGQNDIRYITGESIAVVSSSPFDENLRKKGLEALHVADPMDEYAVHQPKEFDGKMLKHTTEEELDLGDEDGMKTLEELKAEFEPLAELTKEVLGDKVEEEIVDDRTVDSLHVLTTSGHGLHVDMDRVMKAQVPLDSGSQRMHFASGSQQEREERKEESEKVEGEEWETVVGKRRKKGERDQERRKKGKEREAEEGGSEQVKKDVMDWTVVSGSKKRKKMVQIYVKVNGGR